MLGNQKSFVFFQYFSVVLDVKGMGVAWGRKLNFVFGQISQPI